MSLRSLRAVVLSGFTPRRIASANRDTSLGEACLIHWISLLVSGMVVLLLLLADRYAGPDLGSLWREGVLASSVGIAVCAGLILCVELVFGLTALLILPWGDARAPVRSLWRHALRTVWLHTGHLGLTACACTAVHVCCDNLLGPLRRYSWNRDQAPRTPSWLVQWLADYYAYALPVVAAAGIAWCIWALLRAMTTGMFPAEDRPPLCEACGYNLSYHREPGARCPECARPVDQSIGQDLRGPVGWGPFAMQNQRTNFAAASVRAWVAPERFFMGVSASRSLASAAWFLLVHMFLAAAHFFASLLIGVFLVIGVSLRDNAFGLVYSLSWFAAFVGLLCGVGVCLTAAVVGLIVSKQQGRNCTGACLRVACCCAGIVPPWIFCQVTAFIVAMETLNSMGSVGRHYQEVVGVVGSLGLAVALVVFYVGGVARRMRYVRHANT